MKEEEDLEDDSKPVHKWELMDHIAYLAETRLHTRVSQKKLFFDLSLYLLTTHAIGLEEPTKNFSAL